MDLKTLTQLLAQSENEHIEFKEAKSSYSFDKLVDYTIALANERGGKFILGVSDKKPRTIVGTRAFDELNKIKIHLMDMTKLHIEIEEIATPQGRVLIFNIPSRPIGMPLHRNGRYLMRSGESLTSMPADMLRRIFDEAGPDFTAEICSKAALSDLDEKAIEDFRNRWIKKSGNKSIATLTVKQLLSDAELLIDGKLTYGALILFGTFRALGRYLSQSEVVFEYRANDASGPAEFRKEYRQGFFSFYDELWQTIDLRNTNQHFQDGLFIWDIKTFNESAIRETILNAVSHRDYRMNGSVFVRQYPERIEITSPGGLLPGITFENILWAQAPRNRRLAETFAKCGLVERSGQGMNRIFESCLLESKETPDFTHSDADQFWLTLHGKIQHPEFLKVLEKIGEERIRSFTADDLIVLQNVYDNKSVKENLSQNVKALLEEGLLERAPRASGYKWILARRLYTAIGQAGVHTRKKGLDRDTHKALLLKHIKENAKEGTKLEELRQVLPFLNRSSIQVLVRELKAEGTIISSGHTKGTRWLPK
ncbi:putative transcriptional regulator [Treponema primitia ZAS-2]|uniref:Putative transcriptional regulator n=1 Tax=Treponema primitia (strain ATCC BAA-887 / DSM 12427 / ZAS-2) TaxID=545694 RepID=F5YQZ2_TREPZ|nr:ATP-binding protein [Treponema primitia]AEF85606.1 putative transcriptional regulator [Treponema primitia ZAS-2]